MAAYELASSNLEMAACLLLGFHLLLRTGELLALTANDFVVGPDSGICSLKATKTGQRTSSNEAISITDMITLEVLRQLLIYKEQTNTSALPLWSASGSAFRQRFKFLTDLMGLQTHQFRPYSLRRGGATFVFQQTRSMEAALLRGRWNSSRVARIYISDALSFLPSLKMNAVTSSFLRKFHFINSQSGWSILEVHFFFEVGCVEKRIFSMKDKRTFSCPLLLPGRLFKFAKPKWLCHESNTYGPLPGGMFHDKCRISICCHISRWDMSLNIKALFLATWREKECCLTTRWFFELFVGNKLLVMLHGRSLGSFKGPPTPAHDGLGNLRQCA